MKFLAVLSGTIAFVCLIIGVITLLGLLSPLSVNEKELTYDIWFWLSALLFLASIACKSGSRGGEEL